MNNNIDIYNNSSINLSRKDLSKMISWVVILIITLILFFVISFIPYYKYNNYQGYITNNNLKLYIDENDFPLNTKNKLYINNLEYGYQIISIGKDFIVESGKKYYEITLSCDLSDDINIENNIVSVRIRKNKTTLLNEIWKGLMQ